MNASHSGGQVGVSAAKPTISIWTQRAAFSTVA
jgi:hypothetical protein